MKSYDTELMKPYSWLKRQKYIESSDSLGDLSYLNWKLESKIPIDQIKYDPNKYPNEIIPSDVIYMLDNFYPGGFHPIVVDKNFNLKDGQHRLKFAKFIGLKFLDAWVIQECDKVEVIKRKGSIKLKTLVSL